MRDLDTDQDIFLFCSQYFVKGEKSPRRAWEHEPTLSYGFKPTVSVRIHRNNTCRLTYVIGGDWCFRQGYTNLPVSYLKI